MTYPIPKDALDDRLGFIGTSGSGKTYNAGSAVEKLLKSRARVVIVDPLGVWWGLRLLADGKTASPFNVAIFGGPHGDLPLTENAGALIGETAATMAESCIVDLSELGSKASDRRFMTAFLDTIYRKAPGEPFHLVVDEADLFAPQKPPKGDETLLNLMEQIVRRGRVKGFIPWLISQRPAVLNKNVLSQVDGLIAFKLTATQDRDALDGWIEGQADKAQGKAIKDALPAMQIGTGVVWVPGRGVLQTSNFPLKETFDSSRTPKRGEKKRKTAELKPLDLGALKSKLATVEAETKSNDPKTLKAEIAKLKAELAKAPKETVLTNKDDMDRAHSLGFMEGRDDGYRLGFGIGMERALRAAQEMTRIPMAAVLTATEKLNAACKKLELDLGGAAPPPMPKGAIQPGRVSLSASKVQSAPRVITETAPRAPRSGGSGDVSLSQGARKILTAIAQHPYGLSSDGITVLVGYKSTSKYEYLRQLKASGFVGGSDSAWLATDAGLEALGDFEPLPTGPELLRYWKSKLSGGELTLLNAIVDAGAPVDKQQLQEATGYKATSTYEYLRQLKARKLVVDNNGQIELSERLT